MKFNYFSLGTNIKAARKKKGFTQAWLSEKIDVSPSYVSYIESGRKSMSLETNVMNLSRKSSDLRLSPCLALIILLT